MCSILFFSSNIDPNCWILYGYSQYSGFELFHSRQFWGSWSPCRSLLSAHIRTVQSLGAPPMSIPQSYRLSSRIFNILDS